MITLVLTQKMVKCYITIAGTAVTQDALDANKDKNIQVLSCLLLHTELL
jgi:hypothetical protein